MSKLTIPAEGTYGDIEHDFIENEPPGLFPGDQRSVWGQVRATYAAHLQVISDLLTTWYGNLSPYTVMPGDIPEWEYMLDLPPSNMALTDAARMANIQSRFKRGAFTRTRRRQIVETFIAATFGIALEFDSGGFALVPAGLPMFSGSTSLDNTYVIVEDIPHFTYKVYVLNTISVDTVGLTRELVRITPAGITFTLSSVSVLPFSDGRIGDIFAPATVGGRVIAKKQLKTVTINATSTVSGVVTKH